MRRRDHAGYTLTEMMLVVAILGVLFAVGPPLFLGIQNFYLMTSARNDVQRDARGSLDIIDRFLRQAKFDTVVIDTPSNQGPYSRITFVTADGRTVQFSQSGNQLLQTVTSTSGSRSQSVLARDVAYIAFTYPRTDDPSIVSVALTMSRAIYLGRVKVLELTIQKVRIMN